MFLCRHRLGFYLGGSTPPPRLPCGAAVAPRLQKGHPRPRRCQTVGKGATRRSTGTERRPAPRAATTGASTPTPCPLARPPSRAATAGADFRSGCRFPPVWERRASFVYAAVTCCNHATASAKWQRRGVNRAAAAGRLRARQQRARQPRAQCGHHHRDGHGPAQPRLTRRSGLIRRACAAPTSNTKSFQFDHTLLTIA